MKAIRAAVEQPVSVAVGVILVVLAGVVALKRVPIQLTPDVEDTIIAVTTRWEGASPSEVEQDLVDKQEEKLQGVANLRGMTSTSQQGVGAIRLEFNVGTRKEDALREVSDKLRQVPSYPEGVDEPVVEASDPQNKDYIAWFLLDSKDPSVDLPALQDFAEDRLKPRFERVPGVSEVNVLGGREREVQVRFDEVRLAGRGVTVRRLVEALRSTNRNVSAGAVAEAKSDVRVRLVGQYARVEDVEETVVASTPAGPVRVRDVAEVVETFKKPSTVVRARGRRVIAINAQKEVGANVMTAMAGLREVVEGVNAPGGLLESQARILGLPPDTLSISQAYDQTVYIDDALQLVSDNIWLGGALALGVLLLFLGSVRGALIIGLAIPISVVGAVVAMLVLGRTVNVISLAGMAFAVGMVVDNSIVVLENIFRHLEMGKSPLRASVDGTQEVWGAVLASTLTTVAVFIPILLVQEEAGQLFRDIALAIVAAVSLSLVVSVSVIPAAAARILKRVRPDQDPSRRTLLVRLAAPLVAMPRWISGMVHGMNGSVELRLMVVLGFTALSVAGTLSLMPPTDYLPQGNRNLVFGLIIPPPGYNIEQQATLARRIEATVEPYWEAGRRMEAGATAEEASAGLPQVPTFDYGKMAPGAPVTPPPLKNYFLVSIEGILFHGAISAVPEKVVDLKPLFAHATRGASAPGVLAFSFQVPLFRLGGTTGNAVKVNFSGDDLDQVTASALSSYLRLAGTHGFQRVQPDPSNFNVPGPELQVIPDLVRLGEAGLTAEDLGWAVRTSGDGAIVGEYRVGGQTIDLKVVTAGHGTDGALAALSDVPVATPAGGVVPLSALGLVRRVNASSQINREGRRRAVTLQFTPKEGTPLEQAVKDIDVLLAEQRASGAIPPDVETSYTGSASKLEAVRSAMLGDGTLAGLLGSSLMLALVVTYLLMCVLFQSFLHPLVIMFSVPLATLGGFAGLWLVHRWTLSDPYMPVQNLDVLTMLGFIILIGVVVNNAILIVHQALNFMRGTTEEGGAAAPMPAREAITESVRTRVRPIFMSTATSVLGMLPLVLMPGSGSELYRGLGAVVIGGLAISTVFTLVVVPALMSLVYRGPRRAVGAGTPPAAALLLLLAPALLLAPGCAGSPREDRYEEALRGIAARQVRAATADAKTVRVEVGEPRVAEELRSRLPELEALGGPASWEGREPDISRGLDGLPPTVAPISLRDAVAAGALSNLGVRLLRVEAASAAEGVAREEAAFDVVFFAEGGVRRVDEPSLLPVIGGTPVGTSSRASDTARLSSGFRRRTETGGSLTLSGRMERVDSRTRGISYDPDAAWWTGAAFTARQALLRGAGREVNLAEADIARARAAASREVLQEDLLTVIGDVEQAYWDLSEAWSLVRIQQDLLDRGIETERVLAERRAFDADPAQGADARATVELRRADLVRAVRILRSSSDRLKYLMNHPDHPLSSETLLAAADMPGAAPVEFSLEESLRRAVAERPAVRRAVLDVEEARIRERVAGNGSLPRLDLVAEAGVTGLDDDPGTSTGHLVNEDFVNYGAALELEIPLGNRAARADLRRAELAKDAAFLAYERTVREVAREVKDALRDLEAARSLLEATRNYRIAQTENLRALLLEEERRTALTPEFLTLKFSRQERLASAQIREVNALAEWNRALAAWRRALGTGLGAGKVILEGRAPY